ncbi:hypothetical protein BCEP4_320093 [Burkholderia cepacia]|nr:hypothetical protein BCEP4_320093 [Burkholderia cepacia]
MLVSGHRRAMREPYLYGSRRARRDGRRPRGERDLHRPVVRRAAEADRRAADRRDAKGGCLNHRRAGACVCAHAGALGWTIGARRFPNLMPCSKTAPA